MTDFPILQFGASRFLQAHVDLFVSEALPPRRSDGAHRCRRDHGEHGKPPALAAFAAGNPYPVLVKGLSERGDRR